jgi:BACON domain-containing protein/all-beta uncharacterized protein
MGRLARTLPLTSAVIAWLAIAGCKSSSSTQLVAPTTSKCQLSATSSMSTVPAAGGAGTVAIDTTRDCTWSASTTASWITLGSSTSGQGSGTLDFRVGANPAPATRQSAVSVNDTAVLITQAGAPCTFALSPSNPTVGAAGGAVAVQVTTLSGCAWTTSSSTSWLTVTGGSASSGQATITAQANAGPERSGTVTIAGQSVSVSQAAASVCGFTLSSPSQSVPAAGGAVTVQVTTTDGCAWTTSNSTPWLTVTGGGNTSGPATITAAANMGTARTGTVTIAGQTVSVSQAAPAAAACSFTISPTSQAVPAAGGTVTVGVTGGSTCSWTSASNATWVTVAAGASGTGNGVVTLTIAANTAVQRDGTVTIAGQTFTVSQAAVAPCSFSISPTTQSVPAQGGSVPVQVTSASGCAWTATSGATWINVSGAGDGNGNGTVTVVVAANTGNARSGAVTIAGQTFTVNQATGCTFSIAPSSQAFGSDPNSGVVTVTTQAGCSWTSSSSDPDWLSITSGQTGTGNGTVMYAVAANGKHSDRTGRITIADQTFVVTQSGNH